MALWLFSAELELRLELKLEVKRELELEVVGLTGPCSVVVVVSWRRLYRFRYLEESMSTSPSTQILKFSLMLIGAAGTGAEPDADTSGWSRLEVDLGIGPLDGIAAA